MHACECMRERERGRYYTLAKAELSSSSTRASDLHMGGVVRSSRARSLCTHIHNVMICVRVKCRLPSGSACTRVYTSDRATAVRTHVCFIHCTHAHVQRTIFVAVVVISRPAQVRARKSRHRLAYVDD